MFYIVDFFYEILYNYFNSIEVVYMIGMVVEVFIPEEYKDNQLVDVMNSDKIGFKVKLNEDIVTIILEQDERNAEIFREDLVRLIMDDETGKFINIELYDGEEYE